MWANIIFFIFLYLQRPFCGVPLCHIHAATHLGAARCNHNLTTGHRAAPLERLGIKCCAQGQLVIYFLFFLERARRALVIHFPPFSHRITSLNFTLPLTPLHLFPLQMGLVHLDKTGEAISSEKDTLRNEWTLGPVLIPPQTATFGASLPSSLAFYIACIRGNRRVLMQSVS